MPSFRVLVIDDDQSVHDHLLRRITPNEVIEGEEWSIELCCVTVDTVVEDGVARFTPTTMQSLIDHCTKPPDLILADWGFAKPHQVEEVRLGKLSESEYARQVLNARHIPPQLIQFMEIEGLRGRSRAAIIGALQDNPYPMYLYTYTPPSLLSKILTPQQRAFETQREYPKTRFTLIDTLNELFAGETYSVKYDRSFYAYLITGYLNLVIQKELYKYVLHRRVKRRLVYLPLQSSLSTIAIVLLGGAVGASGEWIGSNVAHLISDGQTRPGITLAVVSVLLFAIAGSLLPFFFERLMRAIRDRSSN